jgi:hypothetical protein
MNILVNYSQGHAGPKIMRGFIKALRKKGHQVSDYFLKEPSFEDYDMILGYSGYAVLMMGDTRFNIAHFLDARLVQYWADDAENLDKLCWEGTIFQSDKGCSDRWNQQGLKNTYLPLATDEELFFPMDVEKEFDVILTGIVSPPRLEVLKQLEGLNVAVFGPWEPGWKDCPEFHGIYKGCVATEAELNELYNKSKVCIDASSPQNLNSANFTVFNAMASGCVLVTNHKPALDDLFGEDQPPSFKGNCRELVEKFVNDAELAQKESERQRKVILNGHTFSHRTQALLDEAMKTPPLTLPEDEAKRFKKFMDSR